MFIPRGRVLRKGTDSSVPKRKARSGGFSRRFLRPRTRASGAEAREIAAPFTARLKSCPFTKLVPFSSKKFLQCPMQKERVALRNTPHRAACASALSPRRGQSFLTAGATRHISPGRSRVHPLPSERAIISHSGRYKTPLTGLLAPTPSILGENPQSSRTTPRDPLCRWVICHKRLGANRPGGRCSRRPAGWQ